MIKKYLMIVMFLFGINSVYAQEANINNNVQGQQSIDVNDVRFKKIGDIIDDFIFEVKLIMSINDESKLETLEERKNEIQARQREWIELKQEITVRYEEFTDEEKEIVNEEIEEANLELIEEYNSLIEEIKKIELNGDREVVVRAMSLSESIRNSELNNGLILNGEISSENKADINEETAKIMAEAEFGFNVDSVTKVDRDRKEIFIVKGTSIEVDGNTEWKKEYTLEMDNKGNVLSLDTDVTVRSRNDVNVRDGSASVEGNVSLIGDLL